MTFGQNDQIFSSILCHVSATFVQRFCFGLAVDLSHFCGAQIDLSSHGSSPKKWPSKQNVGIGDLSKSILINYTKLKIKLMFVKSVIDAELAAKSLVK